MHRFHLWFSWYAPLLTLGNPHAWAKYYLSIVDSIPPPLYYLWYQHGTSQVGAKLDSGLDSWTEIWTEKVPNNDLFQLHVDRLCLPWQS